MTEKKKAQRSRWVLVGECPVDSAQLLLIDPCYLSNWKPGKKPVGKPGKPGWLGGGSYEECCNAITEGEGYGQIMYGHGLVSGTGYGDGVYPVYALLSGEGLIEALKVDFRRSSGFWPSEREGGRLPSGEEVERSTVKGKGENLQPSHLACNQEKGYKAK